MNPLPTPQQIVAHLDRFVIGQEAAKRTLALSVYNHQLAVGWQNEQRGAATATPGPAADFGRQHTLVIGPTGAGKTYLTRRLAELLGLPYCFCRAPALSKTGYAGMSMEQMVGTVYLSCGSDAETAGRCVVLLDEIDKIRSVPCSDGPDVSGGAVQEALLPLLDGCTVMAFGDRANPAQSPVEVDTTNMLFICTGAFSGLTEIIQRRLGLGATRAGFGAARATAPDAASLLEQVTREDLEAFGLIPEFIGRFARICHVNTLGTEALAAVLRDGEDSILCKQRRLFELHGVALEVEDAALERLAAMAFRRGTGARGLTADLLKALEPVSFELPELAARGVHCVTITADAVDGSAEPQLEGSRRRPAAREHCEADRLRAAIGSQRTDRQPPRRQATAGITDTRGYSPAQLEALLDQVMQAPQLDWHNTSGSARQWWETFMRENQARTELVIRLAEELRNRNASIQEFFLAYVYSNCDNIQANLHYLDYQRLKKEEEHKRGRH